MASEIRLIHLATGNAHKVQEMQRLANESGLALEIVVAKKMPPVEEDTGTFIGNARKKALALKATLPADAWVLADDSGVCVEALGGEPGVESAYYAGPQGDSAANLRKLTDVMRGVPAEKRAAYFFCVLVLIGPDGAEHGFEGRCNGVLAPEPRGGAGFGYDPLFIPDGFAHTYAQLSELDKNKISHRGRAFAGMAAWLKASALA
ncbi:RdgB/HAM1 family non-canonical purine NTP pyrophosphatase [Oleiharenicola lentus]|uniref:RdgB/HAM1 family non-canonical purine NTP pyrophosphatase n=1 Tax=Oleiharenicola lentus TaxID=2508720 RepID=UPI003F663763